MDTTTTTTTPTEEQKRARLAALRLVQSNDLTLDFTIKTLRTALRARSGKAWSVKRGEGTAYCWITVSVPPSRLNAYGSMTDADREELSALLGQRVHHQGFMVPASMADRRWAILCALTGADAGQPEPYWD